MINNYYRIFLLIGVILVLTGCKARRPVLQHNMKYLTEVEAARERDIDECMTLVASSRFKTKPGKRIADETAAGSLYGASKGNASGREVGLATHGAVSGGALGAASGFVNGVFHRNMMDRSQMEYVENCLRLKGYKVKKWK
jgi:outer membrane lipoprotein SlyB